MEIYSLWYMQLYVGFLFLYGEYTKAGMLRVWLNEIVLSYGEAKQSM